MANWKRTLSAEQIDEAVNYYQAGNSIRKTADEFGVHHTTMSTYLSEREVKIRYQRRSVEWVDDEHIRCSRCKSIVHKSSVTFSTNKTTHQEGYYFSYCKECRSGVTKENRLARGPGWRERASRSNARALAQGLPGTLTAEGLFAKWVEQDGKCFYTDVELIADYGNGSQPNSLSVDRVACDGGYTDDNVVLCSRRANSVKNDLTLDELKEWMPGWYGRLVAAGKV